MQVYWQGSFYTIELRNRKDLKCINAYVDSIF